MTKTNLQSDRTDLILDREQKRLAALKIQAERDKRFKLVAKIISWETGSMDSIAVKSLDRITETEWSIYKEHILGIATAETVEKVKAKLAQTFEDIKRNDGFVKA